MATVEVPNGAAEGRPDDEVGGDRVNQNRIVSGADLRNPQIHTSSFLIEAYFKTAAGSKDAVLIQKIDGVGLRPRSEQRGGVPWRGLRRGHDLAGQPQCRQRWTMASRHCGGRPQRAKTFTIYIDGKQDARGPGLGPDASLANDADLYVGGAPNGHYLNGTIDFLRVARGTLADSKTTIEELYAWEFNGPFLEDFTGRRRAANGGCAGAIDEGAR